MCAAPTSLPHWGGKQAPGLDTSGVPETPTSGTRCHSELRSCPQKKRGRPRLLGTRSHQLQSLWPGHGGFLASAQAKRGAPACLPRSIWDGAVYILGNCRVVLGIGTEKQLFLVELRNNCLEIALSELKYDVPYLVFFYNNNDYLFYILKKTIAPRGLALLAQV